MENNIKSLKYLIDHLNELLDKEAYTASTRKDMNFILDALSVYMQNRNLTEYTADVGKQFVEYCDKVLKVCTSRISRAKNITEKLNRISQGMDGRAALIPGKRTVVNLPQSLKNILDCYIQFCKEIGNDFSTVDYKHWLCSRFLKSVSDTGCFNIEELNSHIVQIAFLSMGGYMRYWQKLSPFFHFLYEQNLTKQDFSKLIQKCIIPQPHPTTYSIEEIRRLESSFDLSVKNDIRNYAITLLMSRYGIRACDVAALTFENVDFSNNRIHFIQQKTGEPWEAVLLPIVKTALENYITYVRPSISNCNNIFISASHPYTAIKSGTINTMINNQFRKTDINITEKRHGSRTLRSSIASNMVNDGISTEVVRNVLGHSSKYAIRHYTKIDIESMRICPLSVPTPDGIFKELLSRKVVDFNV